MINQVTLFGRVVTDLSQRKTHSGASVTSFRIKHIDVKAMSPLFIEIEAWNREAERLPDRVEKGSKVVVHGKLTQDNWESAVEPGKRRSKHKVTANKIIVVGGNDVKREKEEEEIAAD